jgi:hypothetical protein
MQISERLNFNSKLMDFCLRATQWKEDGPQESLLENYNYCIQKVIIAEQIYRSELIRPRPGVPVRAEEEE